MQWPAFPRIVSAFDVCVICEAVFPNPNLEPRFIAFFVDVFLQSGDRLAPVSFCRLTRDIIRFVFLQLRNGGGFAAIDFALIVPGEGDGISGRLPFGSIGGILFVFHLCLKVARCSFVLVVFSNLPFTAE